MLDILKDSKQGKKITNEKMIRLLDLSIEMMKHKSGKNGPKKSKIEKLVKIKKEKEGFL